MISTRALFAMFASVLGATGCGGSSDTLASPPDGASSSSSSSGGDGGPALPPPDKYCPAGGMGISDPNCSGAYQVSGMLAGEPFARTYCDDVSAFTTTTPWTVNDVYSESAADPSDPGLALFLVAGQGMFPESPLPSAGVTHLIDPATDLSGPGQGSRICLAGISRQDQTWTASSLSLLTGCPGTPTDDSLEITNDNGPYGAFTGFIGGVGLNGTGGSFGCVGTICSFDHCSENAQSISGYLRIADELPVGSDFTTQIIDVYIAVGDASPRIYCGGGASVLTVSKDGAAFEATLSGLSSVGTCPGSPLDGTLTWSDASEASP